MIVDGTAIAEELYAALESRRARFGRSPRLGIIVGSSDPAVESFVRIKARAAERLRIEVVKTGLPADATTEDFIEALRALAPGVDGVIVQLPLPGGVDTNAVLSEIPHEKDVDAINPVSEEEHVVDAPVALAIAEVLGRARVPIRGTKTIVVGAGRLVGTPAAALLKRLGAEVAKFTLHEGAIEDLKDADIVVLGAGNPGFVKPEHLKEGVALVDAGTSESHGKLVGDADPACARVASVFTPVPGGMGPVAVAMIFKNLFDLIEKRG